MAEPVDGKRQGGQEPLPEEHDRPEQDQGYDEAARAGGGRDDVWNHMDQNAAPSEDPDDKAAAAAARDVRRREHSAD
ncbi:MAG: hypothetical protein EHM24_06835 [Acidobacteria bacterium]|nr:MAG: hypothetical protein EHM24_06835 [Acidobacteriota bacterium]